MAEPYQGGYLYFEGKRISGLSTNEGIVYYLKSGVVHSITGFEGLSQKAAKDKIINAIQNTP